MVGQFIRPSPRLHPAVIGDWQDAPARIAGENMVRRHGLKLTRRSLVRAGGFATMGGLFTPALSRAADRPTLTHGLQSGDITTDSGIVWARVSQPSRIRVEFSTTE